jgi:hypothetical protein
VDRARLLARQQAASAALEYSELRYRTLAESVALDVFAADRGGRFTTDMPHWRELTGRPGVDHRARLARRRPSRRS